MSRLLSTLETINRAAGRLAGWVCLLLVLATVSDVFMRYAFQAGSVAVQELEWHLFSLVFLLSAGYCYDCDAHVRVDVIYGKLSSRKRALINLFGDVFFLAPFCALVFLKSLPFVQRSWEILEGSPDPGGLPVRFVIKAAIPLGFALLFLSALRSAASNLSLLKARSEEEL